MVCVRAAIGNQYPTFPLLPTKGGARVSPPATPDSGKLVFFPGAPVAALCRSLSAAAPPQLARKTGQNRPLLGMSCDRFTGSKGTGGSPQLSHPFLPALLLPLLFPQADTVQSKQNTAETEREQAKWLSDHEDLAGEHETVCHPAVCCVTHPTAMRHPCSDTFRDAPSPVPSSATPSAGHQLPW